MDSMFEKASRMKLRFDTTKGALTVEDLWDLPLTSAPRNPNLDDIAKDLYRTIKTSDDVTSFVKPESKSTNDVNLKFDIVKYIIDIKMKERDEAAAATVNRERKQVILGIIAQKENESLSAASLDELREMAKGM